MPKYLVRKFVTCAVALFLIAGFLLVNSSAQKSRRKRKSSAPRITNPAISQPTPVDDPNANSSGDTSNANNSAGAETQTARPATDEDPQAMKKTIHTLSTQVDKLTDKINQMEESQKSLVDLERLSRAEQRSSALHTELSTVQAKQAELEARAEDIDYALKPENIERSTAGYGTTRPEELREQRRKQLESERERVRKQLDQLAASQTRLEQAIATSDAEVDRLRKKLDAADEAAIQNAKTKAQAEGTASESAEPRSRPSPTPYPPQ